MSAAEGGALLSVRGLTKEFTGGRGRRVRAVHDVSFDIAAGTTVGLIGESGSGKSTIGRCVLRLIEPTEGRVTFDGVDVTGLDAAALRELRARMQVVFQDPRDAMNPRMTIRALVEEPLLLHRRMPAPQRRARVGELLRLVDLSESLLDRYPGTLSGGQLQRVCIARALAVEPALVVLDEPTSALDVSVRSGVLDLLDDLRRRLNLAYLHISHDLEFLAEHCDEVLVLYLGNVVERGPAASVFSAPQHPYTQVLLSAVLPADPDVPASRHLVEGEQSTLSAPPTRCVFASRCPLVRDDCRAAPPAARNVGDGHTAACVRIDDGSNMVRGSAVAAVTRRRP